MTDGPPQPPAGYAIERRLGAGRTSIVWMARDLRADRVVALKLPRSLLQSDPVLRRMFENEVQITLGLDHPHVVRAFEGRSTGPEAFLALEYCAGGTLDQRLLESGRLPLAVALRLVHEVAMGLAHTHDRRVIHRDVKPANVFLDADGRAKLGDFGTGTFQSDDAERVGTAFYMAPEVFEGRATSVRSDVYSLGVLAYEVLAGERPFVGSSYEALMVAHLHSLPRDLRAVRGELPPTLPRVVARAMSRDPDRRFPDVATFLAAYREAVGWVPAAAPEVAAAERMPTLGRDGARRSSTTPVATPLSSDDGPVAPSSTPAPPGRKARPRWRWWPFGPRRR
jgi:eukaryotic-like serine/threonine-protein kinase